MTSQAISAIVGALVIGLLTVFAIVIGQGVVSGQSTSGWPTVLTSIFPNIVPIIGVVGIIAMFIVVIAIASRAGGGGV
ncbi:MAG: hypothetical protein QW212_00730 [Nitrososphaerales archaeon]